MYENCSFCVPYEPHVEITRVLTLRKYTKESKEIWAQGRLNVVLGEALEIS